MYFKGKRIRIEQNDVIEDAELVKVYPQDFKPVKTSAIREVSVVSNPSSPVEKEPSEAPLFNEEGLEKLHKKELLEIAKSEESPRAFEVFGQLLKNMTDTQEKLMELHRKKQIIENNGERQEVTKAQNVTNALFVGSTAELLKLVKKEIK